MAINPESQYPGKIAPSSSSYPYGQARNITVPGDGTGTPWEAALVNDIMGLQQSILTEAGLVPSGTPDKVGASQYLDGLHVLIGRRLATIAALRNVEPKKDGEQASINGHTTAGVGGGVFYYDASDTTSTDNNGTVVVTSGGARWKRIFSGSVDATWFGARGDGATDDTAAITAAITAYVSVFFKRGTYLCGEVDLPARSVFLYSEEATIQGTSGTHIFKRVERDYLFKCVGLTFTGNSVAFNYDSDEGTLPNGGQRYEYFISGCRFLMAAAVHAIRLYGAREGLITDCYFKDNSAIYTEFAINTVINNCQFKNCNYMILSKLGSEGLIVSNAVALGCLYGVRAERTTGVQINNSMIDYCDAPVYLQGATDVLIQQNYISTRTTSPAIHAVKYPDGFRGYNHVIKGNNIRDNYSTTGSSCIHYEETDFANIFDNVLANYASYAIVYSDITQSKISRNITRNRSGLGTSPILALTDDATVAIFENTFTQAISRTYDSSVWNNSGYKTEAVGEAVASPGSSSVVVTHDLDFTPLKRDIQLSQTTAITGGYDYFVSAITSSDFTITFSGTLSNTVGIAWQAKSRP